ncbi:MAG: hypothetical protein COB01_09430 [Lutibacter sp.]|nr:MAG: hypothetical protein COB01_09430 [Lutibacter sp.]
MLIPNLIYVLGTLFMLQVFIFFSIVSILSSNFLAYIKSQPTLDLKIKLVRILAFIGIAFFILFFY